jgi:hypothetical protein
MGQRPQRVHVGRRPDRARRGRQERGEGITLILAGSRGDHLFRPWSAHWDLRRGRRLHTRVTTHHELLPSLKVSSRRKHDSSIITQTLSTASAKSRPHLRRIVSKADIPVGKPGERSARGRADVCRPARPILYVLPRYNLSRLRQGTQFPSVHFASTPIPALASEDVLK